MQPVVRALLVALCVGGLSLALAKLDLWGANSGSGRSSDNIVQRLGASHYPTSRFGEQVRTPDLVRKPQARIVYLGDNTMAALQPYGWVGAFPTVDQQAVMVSDIAAPASLDAANDQGDDAARLPSRRAPRVVFLDLFYFGYGLDAQEIAAQRAAKRDYGALIDAVAEATKASAWADKPVCRQGALLKLACMVQAKGVAVIVGTPSAAAARTPVQVALDQVALVAPVETHVTRYALTFDGAPAQISPALAMYAAACFSEADRCGEPLFARAWAAVQGDGRAIADPSAFNGKLEAVDVVWGARPPENLSRIESITGCRKIGVFDAWFNAIWRNVKTGGGGDQQACPYTVGVAYENLVNRLAARRDSLADLLSDNIILVGSQMSNSGDWMTSPVQGPVPGVHYHAMALANLLDWGLAGHRRDSIGFVDGDVIEAALVAVLSFMSLIFLMFRNEIYAKRGRGPSGRLSARVYVPIYALMLAPAAVIVGLIVYICAVGHRMPLNWFAVLGLVWLHGAFSAHEAIRQDFGQTLKAQGWAAPLFAVRRRIMEFLDFSETRLPIARPPLASQTPEPSSQKTGD